MASAYRTTELILPIETYAQRPVNPFRSAPTKEPWEQGFTYYGTSDIEMRIHRDLKKIAELVLKFIQASDIVALILTGRYGCGEAGMVLDENRREKLLEKYPIAIVVKNMNALKYAYLKQRFIDWVKRTEIHEEMHMRFVAFYSLRELAHARPTLLNYHLKWGHYVFWGKEDALQGLQLGREVMFTSRDALEILLKQGYRMALMKRRLSLHRCSSHALIRTLYETIVVCGNAYLILKNRYAPTLFVRAQRLYELSEDNDFLDKHHFSDYYWKTIQFLFKPQTSIKLKYVKEMIAEVFAIYEDFFTQILAYHFNCSIADQKSLVRKFHKQPVTHLENNSMFWYPLYHFFLMGSAGLRGNWKYYHPTCRLYAASLGVLRDDVSGKGALIRLADDALGAYGNAYTNRASLYLRFWKSLY